MAFCQETRSVAYFGEDVFFFDDEGNPLPGTGGWRAGENGARPGLIMPGTILVGGGYYQEIAPEDEPSLELYEMKALLHALDRTSGDKLAAARLLKVGKSTLYRKLKRYGIA